MKRRVGIIFCGGCNPRINRGQIASEVREQLEKLGCEVRYNSLDVDFIVFISGCMANCAVKYNSGRCPSVVVAAATLDAAAATAAELVSDIVMKVRAYFEELERTVST